EESGGRFGKVRKADSLDVSAGAAEVRGMLPAAAHGHARHRMTCAEQRAVRILLLAAARYQFLDDDLAVIDDRSGVAEGGGELGTVVGAPGLRMSRVKEMLLDRGLHDEGGGRVDGGQIGFRAREPGPWYRDRQLLRELVRLSLVPDISDAVQARR